MILHLLTYLLKPQRFSVAIVKAVLIQIVETVANAATFVVLCSSVLRAACFSPSCVAAIRTCTVEFMIPLGFILLYPLSLVYAE